MISAHATFQSLADARTCWVVSDGTKGMEVQSIGLAKKMGLDIEYLRIDPPRLLRILPYLGLVPGWPLPEMLLDASGKGWPDLVITTGRRMAGLSILIRHHARGQTKTIHVQDPRLSPALFDYLIVPSHDRLRGANVIVTTGSLNALSDDLISKAGKSLAPKIRTMPKPVLAVMIGGSNRRYQVNWQDYKNLGEFMATVAGTMDASLVFVPSRRSLDHAGDAIRQGVEQGSSSSIPFYIWDGEEENPYPGILDLADAVIVTSDSVNMTSEACFSGKPVYTYAFRRETGRIGRFHEIMQECGHTYPAQHLTQRKLPSASTARLDETSRVAALIRGSQHDP
jgi:mitochondrial fission protein ELM1